MDRRDFVRIAGVGTIVVVSEGLGGCARVLRWSESRHENVVSRDLSSAAEGSAQATSSATTDTAGGETTGSAESTVTQAQTWPDLAVTKGDDAGENTEAAIALLGGMERFVKRGQSVVVKPNIVMAREPKYGVTTNPAAVAAVVRLAWEAGAKSVTVFDRPTSAARQAYTVSGVWKAVDAVDGRMKVLSSRDFERVSIPDAMALQDWPMVADVFDSDVLISMPCAKTHGLAGLTLSIKNLMGILGDERGQIHQDFPAKITDVASLVRPDLVVLDAYRLLVRNGPSGGSLSDVRKARVCVAGTDMVSVDAYGSTLFGRGPESMPVVQLAVERGLGVADLSKLRIEERAV